jgi:hypothetical protein
VGADFAAPGKPDRSFQAVSRIGREPKGPAVLLEFSTAEMKSTTVTERIRSGPPNVQDYEAAWKRAEYPHVHPLPFGGGTPPVPGDPDEQITEGPYKGMTLGQAHAKHFDPNVSDMEFFEQRRKELGL